MPGNDIGNQWRTAIDSHGAPDSLCDQLSAVDCVAGVARVYELVLRVDAGPSASDEQVERQVRNLYRDLRTLGLFHVERKEAPAPAGSMASAGYEIGALLVSGAFSAAALKAVSNVLVAYIQRSKGRSVEWEFDGNNGTFQRCPRRTGTSWSRSCPP